jgi:hypothetical protein
MKERSLTKDEAVALADSKFWEKLTPRERAEFQLQEDRLCMPFAIFHEAVEIALGRPVFTHEFADPELLLLQLRREKPDELDLNAELDKPCPSRIPFAPDPQFYHSCKRPAFHTGRHRCGCFGGKCTASWLNKE